MRGDKFVDPIKSPSSAKRVDCTFNAIVGVGALRQSAVVLRVPPFTYRTVKVINNARVRRLT